MAELHIITENEFRVSRFAQLADQVDGDLSEIIAQAESFIEHEIRTRFDEQAYSEIEWVPAWSQTIFVEERPIVTVAGVSRRAWHGAAWEPLDVSDFRVFAQRGYLIAVGCDVGGYEVQVEYSAGYSAATMPPVLKAAVITQTALLIYQDLEIYGVGDSRPPGILYLEKSVDRFISSFRRATL